MRARGGEDKVWLVKTHNHRKLKVKIMSPEAYAKVKKAFESNPEVNQFVVTSDGQCFTHGNTAANHAGSLKDTSMETVHRSHFEKEVPVVVGESSTGSDTEGTGGETKPVYSAAAEKELIASVNAAETVEAVDQLTEGITWKKVLKAAEKRKAELVG
jgi:hypothetical protein